MNSSVWLVTGSASGLGRTGIRLARLLSMSRMKTRLLPLCRSQRTILDATLRIVNHDPDTGTIYVQLTGVGVAPEISVFTGASTNPADARTNNVGANFFANTALGTASAAQTFTIQNVGSTNLTGLALSKAGANTADFTVSALGATTLAPNATTTFTVTFRRSYDAPLLEVSRLSEEYSALSLELSSVKKARVGFQPTPMFANANATVY